MGPHNSRRRSRYNSSSLCMLENLEARALLSTTVLSGRPLPPAVVGSSASVFLSASADQVTYGADVTLVAHVLSGDGGNTDGYLLDFIDNTPTGPVVIATQNLSNNIATFTWTAGLIGTHDITAQLEVGQAITGTESAPQDVTIAKANTTTLLAQVGNNVVATVTANDVAVAGTGTVSFFEGTHVLATVQVAADGTATFSASSLHIGSHAIVAAYNGSTQLLPSISTELAVTVAGTPRGGGTGTPGHGTFVARARGHWPVFYQVPTDRPNVVVHSSSQKVFQALRIKK